VFFSGIPLHHEAGKRRRRFQSQPMTFQKLHSMPSKLAVYNHNRFRQPVHRWNMNESEAGDEGQKTRRGISQSLGGATVSVTRLSNRTTWADGIRSQIFLPLRWAIGNLVK